jgi:hypothetical protein
VKGGYDGRSLTGEDNHFGGEKHLGEGTIVLVFSWIFWFCGGVLQSLSIIVGGTGLLGVLGTGAKIPFGFLELGSQIGCS